MLRERRRIGHAGKIMGFEGPKPSIGHEGVGSNNGGRRSLDAVNRSQLRR